MSNSIEYIFNKVLTDLEQYIKTNKVKRTFVDTKPSDHEKDNDNDNDDATITSSLSSGESLAVLTPAQDVGVSLLSSVGLYLGSFISDYPLTVDKVRIAEDLYCAINIIKNEPLIDSSPEQCCYKLDQLKNALVVGQKSIGATLTEHEGEQGSLDVIIKIAINTLVEIRNDEVVINGIIVKHAETIEALSKVLKFEGVSLKSGKTFSCISLTKSTVTFLMQEIIESHIEHAKENSVKGYVFDLPESIFRKLSPKMFDAITKLFGDNKNTEDPGKRLNDLSIVVGNLMQNASECSVDVVNHTSVVTRIAIIAASYSPFYVVKETFIDNYNRGLEEIKNKISVEQLDQKKSSFTYKLPYQQLSSSSSSQTDVNDAVLTTTATAVQQKTKKLTAG